MGAAASREAAEEGLADSIELSSEANNFSDLAKNDLANLPESALPDVTNQINASLQLQEFDLKINATEDGFSTTNGEAIDTEKVTQDLSEGNNVGALEDMGLPEDKIGPEAREAADEYKDIAENSPLNHTLNIKIETDNFAKKADDAVGEPKSGEDFKKLTEENEQMKKDIEKLKEDAKKNGSVKKSGKWLTGLFLLGAGFTVYELYEKIHNHACAMSGCWLVNIKTGKKCKIRSLSGNNAHNSQSDYCSTTQFPTPCVNGLCPGTKIPCDSSKPCPPCIQWQDSCTKTKTTDCCAKGANLETECCAKVSSNYDGNGDCGSLFSDNSNNCSPNCDPSKIKIPKGYKLVCNQGGFWAAFSDLGFPDPFSDIGGIFGNILHIFLFIILVIIILAVVYGLFKFSSFFVRG